MDTKTVTLELPASVYEDLSALAETEQAAPADVVARLVELARQRSTWQQELSALQHQIRLDGGLKVGVTRNEVVENLRQARRAIFEAEYANLYR